MESVKIGRLVSLLFRAESGGFGRSGAAKKPWQRRRRCSRFHECITCSRDNPKVLGDMTRKSSVTIRVVAPNFGELFTQEFERRVGELGACCVGFVMRDVSVHDAHSCSSGLNAGSRPDEMQLDPAPRLRQPFPHDLG